MNEEITLAIDELRRRPAERNWFIPILLSDCLIPERQIGAGETLRDIQWVNLASDWELGVSLVLEAIGHRKSIQRGLSIEVTFIRVDEKPVPMSRFEDLKISIAGKTVGVLSGFSILKTTLDIQGAVDIKAECFLDYIDSHPRRHSAWVGTLIHEAVLTNVSLTRNRTILVGYTKYEENWLDRLSGGYYVLRMRTDDDSLEQSKFAARRVP